MVTALILRCPPLLIHALRGPLMLYLEWKRTRVRRKLETIRARLDDLSPARSHPAGE